MAFQIMFISESKKKHMKIGNSQIFPLRCMNLAPWFSTDEDRHTIMWLSIFFPEKLSSSKMGSFYWKDSNCFLILPLWQSKPI